MTAPHSTLVGRAIVALKELFGVLPEKAQEETDTLVETIEVDAEAFFHPIVAEVETLTVEAVHAVVDNGVPAVLTFMAGKDLGNIKNDEGALKAAVDSVKATVEGLAKADGPKLSATAINSLGAVIIAHVDQSHQAATADEKAAGGANE